MSESGYIFSYWPCPTHDADVEVVIRKVLLLAHFNFYFCPMRLLVRTD